MVARLQTDFRGGAAGRAGPAFFDMASELPLLCATGNFARTDAATDDRVLLIATAGRSPAVLHFFFELGCLLGFAAR